MFKNLPNPLNGIKRRPCSRMTQWPSCLSGRPIGQFVDAAFYNAKAYNYLMLAHFTLTYCFPKCQYKQPQPSSTPPLRRRALSAPCTQLWWWQCFSPERVAPPLGNNGSGITDRWPGYCCLWYLLVNFCNQYNISQQSPREWKPETVHLILKPAPALCSAAKLGSWPTWCGIIAAEVRCELSRAAPDEWLFLIKRLARPTRDI